jgi:hypothetical protein
MIVRRWYGSDCRIVSMNTLNLAVGDCVALHRHRIKMAVTLAVTLVVTRGQVWLSYESPLGARSSCPLIDVVLGVGQSYSLTSAMLARPIYLSSFQCSEVRLQSG